MKWFYALVLALIGTAILQSAPLTIEAPIKDVGTPVTVAISSTTLTKVPTSQTTGRLGLFVSNPAPDISVVSGFLGNCTSTALASTIKPIRLSTHTYSDVYLLLRDDVCLWLVAESTVTATRSIHYQEVKK